MGNILERMVKEARLANGGRQLPYPQDIKLRLNEGETCRVSLAWWEKDEDGFPAFDKAPRFIACERHYIPPEADPDNRGGYVLCKRKTTDCPWCSMKDETARVSRQAIATLVAVWPTDKNGNLDVEAFRRQECDIIPWVMAGNVVSGLRMQDREWPLSEYDLMLSCDNAQFQRISTRPGKENLFRKLLDKAREPVDVGDPAVHSRVSGWVSSLLSRVDTLAPMLTEVLAAEDLSQKEAAIAAKVSFLDPVSR